MPPAPMRATISYGPSRVPTDRRMVDQLILHEGLLQLQTSIPAANRSMLQWTGKCTSSGESLVDDDVLNPADLGQDPASASTWFFGWMRQFFGLARRLLASTSSWPTIRLRHFLASAEGFSGSA